MLILFVSVAMFSILAVSASVVSTTQTYTTANDGIQIEAKYKKASTYKITFNANGGKIGSKKTVATNIKKGAKINKFPATPKRTGYTFEGWFSKKSGGKKISVNTKPTKNIIYYAQWKKVLTAEEKKLVGGWGIFVNENGYKFLTTMKPSEVGKQTWKAPGSIARALIFRADGSYESRSFVVASYDDYYTPGRGNFILQTGTWSISKKGTVTLKNLISDTYYRDGSNRPPTQKINIKTVEYSFGPDFNGNGYGLMWKEIYVNGQFFDKFA